MTLLYQTNLTVNRRTASGVWYTHPYDDNDDGDDDHHHKPSSSRLTHSFELQAPSLDRTDCDHGQSTRSSALNEICMLTDWKPNPSC